MYFDVLLVAAPSAAPENITIVDISPSFVILTWDPPPYEMQNGLIRHYIVEVTELETSNVINLSTTVTNITVNDLLPFYNYTCTVAAETVDVGSSSYEISFVLPEGGCYLHTMK